MAETEQPRRRRWIAISFGAAAVVLFLVAGLATAVTMRAGTIDGNIARIDGAVPAEQDRPSDDPGENWLLMGSDLRGESTPEKWRSGEAHSDVIMLLHVPDHEKRAYVISIPRDAWTDIPDNGEHKINEAFAEGGPALLTSTVEDLSGVRIDHFAAIDFAGFEQMTDALGGVELDLPYEVYDESNGWYWEAGENHMDGEEALRFVRERKGLGGSDTGRIERQHFFLRAMAEKAGSSEVRGDPARLDAFLTAASKAVSVDSETSFAMMRSLALRLIDVGVDRTAFVSLPVEATGWEDDKNVLYLDEEAADGIFEHVRGGGLEQYLDDKGLGSDAESFE
ncbi:LCP family protein [Nocardiopsis coralliicola]